MGDQASVTFAPALKHSEQCIGAQPKLGSADALPMLLIRSGSCQPGLDLGSDDRALRFGIKNSAFDLGRSKANLPTGDVFTALSRNVLPGSTASALSSAAIPSRSALTAMRSRLRTAALSCRRKRGRRSSSICITSR
jgi:hypothetical protein